MEILLALIIIIANRILPMLISPLTPLIRCLISTSAKVHLSHDLGNAKLYFEKAIEIDPNEGDSYYQYAKFLRDYAKDYKESEKNYLKAFELNDEESSHGSYGYLLYLMGDYDKAMKHVEMELYQSCGNNEYAHL